MTSSDLNLDDLREELADFAQTKKKKKHTRREQRIIAGFEEIQRFVDEHGHAPLQGGDRDIFERLYAVRLEQLRALEECYTLLLPFDHQGLLARSKSTISATADEIDTDVLLADLGDIAGNTGITELRHVRSTAERRAAEEIANREPCPDFDQFKPLFEQVNQDLKAGTRQVRRFENDARVEINDFFILGGQIVWVAEKDREFTTPQGHLDARLRAIYSNGTESNLLMRSLQRALNRDKTARRITWKETTRSLFSALPEDSDIKSGTIYVLRSLSDHPFIAEQRELIHKIGVTGGDVQTRIANAAHDATYLLADVEVVAAWTLANVNRVKLEALFHRIFALAQLDLTIQDRFGHPVKPREWFLVPLHIINEAAERIRNGSITDIIYNPETVRLEKIQDGT